MIYHYFIINTYYKVILYRFNIKCLAKLFLALERFVNRVDFGREYSNNIKIVKVSTKQLYDFVSICNDCSCSGVYHFDNLSCFCCSHKSDCKENIVRKELSNDL